VRAVLDPNVVISGLLSPAGVPAQVLRAWEEGRFELIASPLLIEELGRALGYPKLRKRIPVEDAEAVVRWYGAEAIVVEDPSSDPPVRSEDAGDDYLIALAADQRAALVSGDAHLLALTGRIPVYSPREFAGLI
jgi:putative PIN family toxin of toxin-antitoxin system